MELQFLPGLASAVAAEVTERVPVLGDPAPVPGRDDALLIRVADERSSLARVLALRTVVSPYLLLAFDVPRPRALLSPEHLDRIVRAIGTVRKLGSERDEPIRSFRFDAAGRDSSVFRALAERLGRETGLVHAPEDGDCLLRFRRAATGGNGWEVLVRLSARPLSSRPWRTASFPGAINATIAAAAVRMTCPRPGDRVLNLMCGSGTLLAERLLLGPVREAVGIDRDPRAIEVCAAVLASAGVSRDARLQTADISTLTVRERYDVVLACPPWGDKIGRDEDVDRLHEVLLDQAHAMTNPGARLVVISHRVRAMSRSLAERPAQWRQLHQTRVWAKGHHPRIYALGRR